MLTKDLNEELVSRGFVFVGNPRGNRLYTFHHWTKGQLSIVVESLNEGLEHGNVEDIRVIGCTSQPVPRDLRLLLMGNIHQLTVGYCHLSEKSWSFDIAFTRFGLRRHEFMNLNRMDAFFDATGLIMERLPLIPGTVKVWGNGEGLDEEGEYFEVNV